MTTTLVHEEETQTQSQPNPESDTAPVTPKKRKARTKASPKPTQTEAEAETPHPKTTIAPDELEPTDAETIASSDSASPPDEPTSPNVNANAATLLVDCNQELLATALAYVAEIVPNKPLQPVLANVLLVADGDGFVFTGTSLNETVKATVAAEVGNPGKCTIPVTALEKVVARSAAGRLTLSQSNRNGGVALTIIDSEAGRTMLTGMDASEFPDLPRTPALHSLPSKAVLLALKTALVAASKDETKATLSGVNWQLNSGEEMLMCTATDGNRVVQVTAELGGIGRKKRTPENSEPVITCNLRLKFVQTLCKVLSATNTDAQVNFGYDPDTSQAVFIVSVSDSLNLELTGRCHEGAYPDVNAVIGRFTFDKEIVVERAALQTRLERVGAIVDSKSPTVALQFTGTELKLEKEEATVQSQQTLDAGIADTAQGMQILFNIHYLLSFVKDAGSSEIKLTLGTSKTLARLEATGSVANPEMPIRAVYYLMPMATQS